MMPTMEEGDILSHEPMGIVVDKRTAVSNLDIGDREMAKQVLVP